MGNQEGGHSKDSKDQDGGVAKPEGETSKTHLANDNKVHQPTTNIVDKHKEKKGTVVNVSPNF